ncbi:hypothetical protein Moror_3807 [Moniliophthora roreri MCA 2997]|uniref:Uncharacterized protein n=1 Tax=Moniliophthora roreri (strain MCA 2997) TaxID=1381753 RepID=V2WBQ4_MONRO|nr:hypothetical protein Moror_3807 [Moniliophthora roreri MCA 2997]
MARLPQGHRQTEDCRHYPYLLNTKIHFEILAKRPSTRKTLYSVATPTDQQHGAPFLVYMSRDTLSERPMVLNTPFSSHFIAKCSHQPLITKRNHHRAINNRMLALALGRQSVCCGHMALVGD